MNRIPGTEGYERSISWFIEICQELNFHEACEAFLKFLPSVPARVLDIGAGAGQNSAALAALGYSVTAVEPMTEFLSAARIKYSNHSIVWLNDSLPTLASLRDEVGQFHFILVAGVWHHLNTAEQVLALRQLARLLSKGGCCALTLRNGPPGLGTCVHSTDSDQTINQAKAFDLRCVLHKKNGASILSNKNDVKWGRIVFQKM